MDWQKELTTWFDTHREEGIELLAALVREDTVNPPGNEYRAAHVVEDYLAQYGIEIETHENEPGRTNILAAVGTGDPVVFVPAHLDVVPVGEGWDTPPFEPVIKDGIMYGRGTVDDKGPLASVLLLAAFLSQHTDKFDGTFLVGAVADEECGSTHGMVYLTEKNLIQADMAIVPDTGMSTQVITCGEKGLLHIDVQFHGTQGHGSRPEEGLNAVWAAHAFLTALRDIFGEDVGYLQEGADPLFSPTSVNVGQIQAGSAYNIIPGLCTIKLDIRYRPTTSAEALIARITEMCETVKSQGLCVRYDVQMGTHMPPYVVEQSHALVEAVTTAVQQIHGAPPTYVGMSGTTVCKQLVSHGIPAIGFSQNAHNRMHQANEHIYLDEIPSYGIALGVAFIALCNRHTIAT